MSEVIRNLRQLPLPSPDFAPNPVVVSASRRTELVGLKPGWLVNALQGFTPRFKRDFHSVVLWTKDFRNIYENPALREELSKYNLMVHGTITGLGGSRIEPTVPETEKLINALPDLLDFLGDTKRFRWRFDPIVTLEKEDGSHWSSVEYFESLAEEMAKLGIDNCYFSFCQIYPRKFRNRNLNEAEIKMVVPPLSQQREVVERMKQIAIPLGITLYSCTQPQLEGIEGITPASCIDSDLLVDLHPQHLPLEPVQDLTMTRLRPGCYCTQSRDIGAYLPCGHGCVYCYAKAAVPSPEKLLQRPMPWETAISS